MDPLVVPVVSRRPPTIAWRCSACSGRQEFENTEKFRANANGKLIDIWVIYRCSHCGERKNLSVIERTPVARVPSQLLQAAHVNDRVLARSLGRDLGLMRRNHVEVARGDDWDLPELPAGPVRPGQLVALRFEEPLLVRLDHVIGTALGVARTKTRELSAGAFIEVRPHGRTDRLRLWPEASVLVSRLAGGT